MENLLGSMGGRYPWMNPHTLYKSKDGKLGKNGAQTLEISLKA